MEIVGNQTTRLIVDPNSKLSVKIKYGNPTQCKIILKKRIMLLFLQKLINEIFPTLKKRGLLIRFETNFIFLEIAKNYNLFNTLPALNIKLITNKTNKLELNFLFNSLKFYHLYNPYNYRKNNSKR